MFSDNKKPRTMNEIGGQPNRIEKNTKIKGDIVSEADFRIDGKLDGNVKTSGKVVIGKDGLYQFDISDPADMKEISLLPVNRD